MSLERMTESQVQPQLEQMGPLAHSQVVVLLLACFLATTFFLDSLYLTTEEGGAEVGSEGGGAEVGPEGEGIDLAITIGGWFI